MYGIFIRDNVAKFRTEISATLADTKQAIAAGGKGKEVFGDGVLQGAELTRAKAAAKDLEKALKALKPVFPGLPTPIMNPVRPGTFPGATATGPGVIRPMYGMALRDDLAKFKSEISTNVTDIRAAINSGQLKGADKTEAQKAIKYLDAALKDLNGISSPKK